MEVMVLAIAREVSALVRGTGLADAPVMAVAKPQDGGEGEGVAELRERLLSLASASGPDSLAQGGEGKPSHRLARYVVDRAFTRPGSGTVVTGTLIAGVVSLDDRLLVSPAGLEGRVRALQVNGRPVAQVRDGERCAINLAGVAHGGVSCGDWLVAPGAHNPSDRIDVALSVLAGEPAALKHWMPVHVHIGAADVSGRLVLRRGAAIEPGATRVAQLRLERPVCVAWGDRFVLRDQSAMRTLGGGAVIDPLAGGRRPAALRDATPAALGKAEPREAISVLLAVRPAGLDVAWAARVFAVTHEHVLSLLPPGTVAFRSGTLAFAGEEIAARTARLVHALERFHAEHPGLEGLDARLLRRTEMPDLPADVCAALLRQMDVAGTISLQGQVARLAGHRATVNQRELQAWQALRPVLAGAAFQIPSVRELSARLALPMPVLKDLLHRRSMSGELVKLTPERYGLRETLEQLAGHAQAVSAGLPRGLFTAAQFRDSIGTGRSIAIEILECLDRLGITRRAGEARRFAAASPPTPIPEGKIPHEHTV